MLLDQRTGTWEPAGPAELRPGLTVVLDAAKGGYLEDQGLTPASRTAVEPVVVAHPIRPESLDTQPLSVQSSGRWVSLSEHLGDTEREAVALLDALGPDALGPDALDPGQRDAVVHAARLHDLGKAHPTFQRSLERANPDSPPPADAGPWAKSPGARQLRHDPPHFRHELVSALLLTQLPGLLDGVAESDLVVYLVAAHHGGVRVSVRGHPEEKGDRLLGVSESDYTLACEVPGFGALDPQPLSLAPTRLGRGSLAARALGLRDRLGPFRLAWCEAVVVAADWRASAGYVTQVSDSSNSLGTPP
jgi:CRISPR-associated endonuclease/helicase Cas3